MMMPESRLPDVVQAAVDVFSPGDVVELKSGSPRMTVSNYDAWQAQTPGGGQVTCSWFTKDDELRQGVFKEAMLSKVDRA